MPLHLYAVDDHPEYEEAFYTLPWKIYQDDPYWVPPIIGEIRSVFNPEKNAFYKKGETRQYIAFRRGEPVGRVTAMINHAKDFQTNPHIGGFGFFECINDQEVCNVLLDQVKAWHQSHGIEGMRGPINFGETDRWWGLLVENFTEMPTYGINHNPPYYQDLLKQYGLVKEHDQFSYKLDLEEPPPERLVRIGKRVFQRPNIKIRMVDLDHLDTEAEIIRQIYNTAWQEMDIDDFFDQFTPLTEETIQQMIGDLKPVLFPAGAWLAFVDDEPASFILTIPDVNQVFRHLSGKLNLFSIPKFLWYKREINRLRVVAYGTVKKYRRLGLEAGIFVKGIQYIRKHLPQYSTVIAAWTGEENWLMQRSIEGAGGHLFQKHRTFQTLFPGMS